MKKALYSCDHCGAPVSLHARSCPSCAKVFDAVRCPRCGRQGQPAEFGNGCPGCGYLASPSVPGPVRARRPLFVPVMTVVTVLFLLGAVYAWLLRSG